MFAHMLRSAYDAIPDALFIVNPQSLQIDYANRHAQQLTGLSVADLQHTNLLELHPAAVQQMIRAQLEALEHGAAAIYEAPVMTSRRTPPPVIEMHLHHTQIDQQPYIIGIARDITERYRAAQALQESEILYRSLVEAIFDLMFRITRDGVYRDYKVPEASGLPIPRPENIIGKHVAEVVPDTVAQAVMPAIQRVVETGEMQMVEYQIEEPDGLHYYEARFVHSLTDEIVAVVRDVTRKQREAEALRQSEATARALLNASSDIAILVDRDWRILAINETGAQRFGIAEPDLLNYSLAALFPPEVVQKREPHADRIMRTKNPTDFEDSYGGRHLSTRMHPVLDDQGNIVQIAIFSRDITAEKQAHNRLVQQSALLSCVAEAAARLLEPGDFDTAIQHAVTIAGQTTEADRVFIMQMHLHPTTGIPLATMQYEWVCEGVAPAQHHTTTTNHVISQGMQRWLDMLSKGEIIQGLVREFPTSEQAMLGAFGSVSIVAFPIFVGKVFWGLIGFDMQSERTWTEDELRLLQTLAASIGSALKRQQDEDQLRQEREFADTLRKVGNTLTQLRSPEDIFRKLLELIRPIIPYDSAGALLLVGDHTARLIISVDHEHYGLTTHDVMRMVFDIEKTPILRLIMETQQPYVCQSTRTDPAWVKRSENPWIQSSLVVPIVSKGEVRGFFTLDSTHEGFYQQRHADLIESFAMQAAIALDNAWYLEDIRHLEYIKSEMIDIASHDLRSPLARIQIYAQRLRDELESALTPKHRRALEFVVSATHEMERIIDNFLSQERIEAQHRSAQPIFWCEIIDQAAAAAQDELEIHNHTLEIDCPPDLPVIRGNPVKLERAIYNLLQNAIKYTPPSGTIKIRAFIKPYGPRTTIAIEVEDNGIGIAQDHHERVFQRGYRVQQPGTEHIEGTGMGLATVKTTIEEHNGHVYFDSAPGEGSMFGFWIPLRTDLA